MPELKVRTRGIARSDNKPKVYFTCHPNDIEPWFDTIVAALHEASDCAVYFTTDASTQFDNENWELDLSRMQLFVAPVTYRLLTEQNRAIDSDIPFALALPLVA